MHGQGNKRDSFNDLLILSLKNAFIGKMFRNNGNRYEGKWKEDKKTSQCNSDVLNDLFINSNINQCFNRQYILRESYFKKVHIQKEFFFITH